MVKFDPSRTKDGNIAARLESFVRSVTGGGGKSGSIRHAPSPGAAWGQAAAPWDHPPAAWHPSQHAPDPHWQGGHHSGSHKGGGKRGGYGMAAPLDPVATFVRQWDLNAEAGAWLADLPQNVSGTVFSSFDA